MRDYEINNIDYKFLTEEEFIDKINNGEMIEYAVFRGWYYGKMSTSFNKDKINIGVFTPNGIRTLLKNKDIEVKAFYISCSPKTRLIRQLKREISPDVDEIIRRYNTDKADFTDIEFEYEVINNDEHEFTEYELNKLNIKFN